MSDWTRVDRWAIKNERWTISKAFVGGVPKYSLWDGNALVGVFTASADAISATANSPFLDGQSSAAKS